MATYTPSTAVDMSKEKDWPMALGMMDWDTTNIVFTKRSLLEFLKYGPRHSPLDSDLRFQLRASRANIQKLP
ncbi:hypothetical protein EIP91_011395, partial [Steccherinum ochraceum]